MQGYTIFIFAPNIDCGYLLEPPHRGENFQFLQLKKNLYIACTCFRSNRSINVLKVEARSSLNDSLFAVRLPINFGMGL